MTPESQQANMNGPENDDDEFTRSRMQIVVIVRVAQSRDLPGYPHFIVITDINP